MIDFTCPKCGKNGLTCRHTGPRGVLLVRFYKCKFCGHRGQYISGFDRCYWKDSERRELAQHNELI